MRYARARFVQSVALLGEVFLSKDPSERTVEKFFRRHKKMGSKDRRETAEIVYHCIRRKLELETLVELSGVSAATEVEAIVACDLIRYFEWLPADFDQTDTEGFVPELYLFLTAGKDHKLTLAQTYSLPDWLFNGMKAQFSEEEINRLGEALLQTAHVDIRVNTLVSKRSELLKALQRENVELEVTQLANSGLRVSRRGPLQNSRSFRAGEFEFQDEGSQLISWLANPKPGELVVDYCAGAGGKTLHLAALMKNKGRIVACDVYASRLERLVPRLTRAKVEIVEMQTIDPERGAESLSQDVKDQADCVLIDAPCSGVGTLRRHASLKWVPQELATTTSLQAEILNSAAQLVRSGGVLIYATCSFLEAENQQIVDSFLASNKEFVRSENWIAQDDPELVGISELDAELAHNLRTRGELVLRPDLHGTDGFYAQRLERR